MSITATCMVLNLRLGIWTGHRQDKSATQQLVDQAGAETDAARVNKHLISKAVMQPVTRAANAVRTHFYDATLPWKDSGDRVISRKAFAKFIARHEELVSAFEQAATEFCRVTYPREVERASFRMGDLFDPTDYPSPAEVRRRFYAALDIDPVSDVADFRVQLSGEHQQMVESRMVAAMQDRVDRAMTSVWDRMTKVLGAYVERTESGSGIRIELVNNLRELVAVLPELNLIDDGRIDELRQMMDDRLSGFEAKDLRESPEARAAASQAATEIMDKMRGYMAAFGNAQ